MSFVKSVEPIKCHGWKKNVQTESAQISKFRNESLPGSLISLNKYLDLFVDQMNTFTNTCSYFKNTNATINLSRTYTKSSLCLYGLLIFDT